jgi:hypothetical protein
MKSGPAWVMFSPDLPAIRNFRAGLGLPSTTNTRRPAAANASAAIRPAGPAPMTSASVTGCPRVSPCGGNKARASAFGDSACGQQILQPWFHAGLPRVGGVNRTFFDNKAAVSQGKAVLPEILPRCARIRSRQTGRKACIILSSGPRGGKTGPTAFCTKFANMRCVQAAPKPNLRAHSRLGRFIDGSQNARWGFCRADQSRAAVNPPQPVLWPAPQPDRRG